MHYHHILIVLHFMMHLDAKCFTFSTRWIKSYHYTCDNSTMFNTTFYCITMADTGTRKGVSAGFFGWQTIFCNASINVTPVIFSFFIFISNRFYHCIFSRGSAKFLPENSNFKWMKCKCDIILFATDIKQSECIYIIANKNPIVVITLCVIT